MAENLLINPSFEGDYHAQDGIGELQVADGWRAVWWPRDRLPLWAVSGGSEGPIRRPEYKALTREIDAGRVQEGDRSQCFFTFYGVMLAGVYQVVTVPAGAYLQAVVSAQTWTSANDDPHQSTGEMYVTVGIDPSGGQDPWARHVLWAAWQAPSYDHGLWRNIYSPVVLTHNSEATVYVMAHHKWAIKHGDLYLDSAELYGVDLNNPDPEPEPEPGDPIDYDRIKADTLDALAGWDRR